MAIERPQWASAASLAEYLSTLCANASPQGTGYLASCPAHDDANPSLSITPGDEQVLLHCFAGCEPSAIAACLAMELADLFTGSRARKPKGSGRTVTAVYSYYDLAGTVVHETVRYSDKKFSQRRPDPANQGDWIWNLRGINTVLYRLPDITNAIQAGQPIYIVEGEKDAERLWDMGLAATCNPMGAGKWHGAYASDLRGATCYLLPDYDDPGMKHMQAVARSLSGVAARVAIVEGIHTEASGSDVSDWLAKGHTRGELELIAGQTAPWSGPRSAGLIRVEGVGLPPQTSNGLPPAQGLPKGQPPDNDEPIPRSDYSNAVALVESYGHLMRYCKPWEKWYGWTDTHWLHDQTGQVDRYAVATIKAMLKQAPHMDEKQVLALLQHVKSSLSNGRINGMISMAQKIDGIPVLPDQMDTHPWLLNCTNGTLDLRSGELKPHDPADMLTQCLSIPYEPGAACPQWLAFLDRIMAGNEELIAFLQRAVGYALTGVVREHVLLILWGTGRNGKSTFVNTVLKLLGPYGCKAVAELLLTSANDRHPTERADLFRRRFVAVLETEQGKRLAETFVKEASGGDPIKGRRMREDFWEFWPTHKLFMATNHKPHVKGTDNAIWERLKLVRFDQTIQPHEMDRALPEKLEAELPGILAWAVEGCNVWREYGLGEPEEVTAATADYRNTMDMIGRFLDEVCHVGNDSFTVGADQLYKAYCQWTGHNALTTTEFKERLNEKGYLSVRKKRGMFWQRIGLPVDTDSL